MRFETSNRPWISVVELLARDQGTDGLRLPGEVRASIPWSGIARVAAGSEIDAVRIYARDFWAFQTEDPHQTWWVTSESGELDFTGEVERRYLSKPLPLLHEWPDPEFSIRTFVVWPECDRGNPMYVNVKRHWWSWSCKLGYFAAPRTAP
ncbi:MAG: hypothetical protein IT452_03895 [Planctomycetia bacterium]|nr:hypothetical protein [Planctomycetia bacterium]